MSRNNDASGALALAIIIIMIIIGFAVNQKVKELADFMVIDMDTAWSFVQRSAVFFAILIAGLFTGHIKKLLPYLPFGLFMVAQPVLTFWGKAHSSGLYQVSDAIEAAWYGVRWIQVVIALLLLAVGFFWQWKRGDFD